MVKKIDNTMRNTKEIFPMIRLHVNYKKNFGTMFNNKVSTKPLVTHPQEH